MSDCLPDIPRSDAGLRRPPGLIREIHERRATAVFAKNTADARLVEQIAAEAALRLGGTLYSDALSEPDGPAPTDLELIRHNVSTITAAIAAN